MIKRALLGPLLFTFFFTAPLMVSAENAAPLQMEELTIQVMPEFAYHPKDKKQAHPPLLVGYHGSLKNNTGEPQKGQVELPLPIGDENFKIGFVADYSHDLTEMNEIQYELNKESGTISWTTSDEIQPQELYKFVIEYYTDSIKDEGEKNTLQYEFQSFSNIGLMNLIFVEPLKTDRFKLAPEAESHQKNSYNMNMFIYQSQGMKPGDTKAVSLEYVRGEEKTTGEIMEEMAGPSAAAGAATKNEEAVPVWMIGAIAGSVTAAAALLILFLKKRSAAPVKNGEIGVSAQEAKKAKLRSMLMEGRISEEEYAKLVNKLGGR
ncbi:hypothetical protein [Mesobacillus campisalis]|uniref:hypothetical protein n=1 Tax=Mesobacillus campisalis TaxID=1408103 RepID=UPI00069C4396|nr:hypothetical protein [Mesobacillus campisalis]